MFFPFYCTEVILYIPFPTVNRHEPPAAVVEPTTPAAETAPADPGQDGDPEYANVAVEKPIRVSELTDYFQRLYSTPNGFRKEFLVPSCVVLSNLCFNWITTNICVRRGNKSQVHARSRCT